MDSLERDRMSESAALMDRAEESLAGGVSSYARTFDFPLSFERGDGSRVVDVDGNEYVDYLQAWGAIVLGHSEEEINRAASDALDEQDLFGMGTTEREVELAEMIKDRVPSAERVLFGVTGSEVVARAIMVARAATGRKKIIKFQGQYNGWYDPVATNHLDGTPGSKAPFGSGMLEAATDETVVLPFNDLDAVEATIEEHENEIAGIILEPVSHNMGCIPPTEGYLRGLRELTDEHGIVLIFDEVVTGFRHDIGGVQRIEDVTPDLTTMGKAVANGYPMSILCGKAELMEQFHTAGGDVSFGGTYNAHASSLAAAKETIEQLESRQFHERAREKRDEICDGLEDILEDVGLDAHVSRYGTVFLTYFMDRQPQTHREIAQHHDDERYHEYRMTMLDRGVLMVPKPVRRNFLTDSHTDEDVRLTLEAAEDSFREID